MARTPAPPKLTHDFKETTIAKPAQVFAAGVGQRYGITIGPNCDRLEVRLSASSNSNGITSKVAIQLEPEGGGEVQVGKPLNMNANNTAAVIFNVSPGRYVFTITANPVYKGSLNIQRLKPRPPAPPRGR